MSFNKFDIKVQEAARHHHPEPDKEAWNKMEKLLDIHLPQKKDGKRRMIWLWMLSFIVIGASLLVFILSPFDSGRQNIQHNEKANPQLFLNKESNLNKDSQPADDLSIIVDKLSVGKKSSSSQALPKIKAGNNVPPKRNSGQKNKTAQEPSEIITNKNLNSDQFVYDKTDAPGNKATSSSVNGYSGNNKASDSGQVSITHAAIQNTDVKKNDTLSKVDESIVTSSNNKNISRKGDRKFNTSFSLTLSAGPDVSAVEPSAPGRLAIAYGVGAGYNLSKRWTLRTGFYVTKKTYDAEVGDYHPPERFWSYYPDLNYIDADCKVYEVPLILSYNFGQTAKHFWFGSAGISSYFMKKETYYYYPKDQAVSYPNRSYTINNKNQHFLSSLRLSAGYVSPLNKKNVSIIAEPYINLPLSGVGFGKVKLYSAGVLFTVSMKPFKKK